MCCSQCITRICALGDETIKSSRFNTSCYLEDTVSVHDEIDSTKKTGSACCHSMQNLLSSCTLSTDIKIKKYRIITLLVVLYGCETYIAGGT
jgi:hypothetical protein